MGRDTVYFVSDAHFGLDPDERVKTANFAELAAQMRERATDVFFVGDMFVFWIEYTSLIRRDCFMALHIMRGLVEAGVRVHYVAGNHDFALGTFMEETAGIRLYRSSADVELQGRKAHISHGDRVQRNGLLKIIHMLLRCRPLHTLFRLIHHDIGIRVGMRLSAASKMKYRKLELSPEIRNKYRRAAQSLTSGQTCDLVVFAHTHHADLLSIDGGDYCHTGSWMDNYDYAVLRGGRIRLMRWKSLTCQKVLGA
jgi:UDP-2,3-diacylglucosamine hydrolase